ncbi:PREDICTED: dual 3',5'-cyclic-AMP and -GMP phosphodiesterase 11A-like [Priapulus caudatus]|uniref:Dual 3',5'-cyclic-AMP and -GMP phosphodiesterase 11A-like n=1 Tax=Priapulus caudatus TaxID=37621 RepID=A0ABM1E1U7_PRICU|nr:PREDICTED: dual 3',5'-cyclic-AMP and -GMP phosphodiesterase 11A-like [Priapulus caudatus]
MEIRCGHRVEDSACPRHVSRRTRCAGGEAELRRRDERGVEVFPHHSKADIANEWTLRPPDKQDVTQNITAACSNSVDHSSLFLIQKVAQPRRSMTRLTYHDVEQWMDANPDSRCDYFLRKADLSLVNKWLLCHGHDTVLTETKSACRRSSAPGHAPTVLTAALSSPLERVLDTHVEGRATTTTTSHSKPKPPPRSNSRKFLRQDFAKCKNTLLYRTCEAAVVSSEMPSSDVEARRNSLKNMRQYTSLPPSSLNMLSHLIESKIRLPRHVSKDAAQLNELRRTNEREFFLDIVKDIANEMDVRHLSSKVTQNIRLLLDVDHSSLFLIQKSHKGKVLVSKQFDAYTGTNVLLSTSGDNVVQVPWGTGIIGHVADSGETVNLTQASEDPRYDNEADRMTGYETNTLLCMPITDTDGVVIGVTQVINKRGGQEFTKDDEKLLQTYLSFFGIALANARLFEASRQEQLNNKALLEVVHDLFEEQDALDGIVLKIMQKTLRLLKCERCCVFLLDDNGLEVTFNKLFDLTAPNRTKSKQASGQANTGYDFVR